MFMVEALEGRIFQLKKTCKENNQCPFFRSVMKSISSSLSGTSAWDQAVYADRRWDLGETRNSDRGICWDREGVAWDRRNQYLERTEASASHPPLRSYFTSPVRSSVLGGGWYLWFLGEQCACLWESDEKGRNLSSVVFNRPGATSCFALQTATATHEARATAGGRMLSRTDFHPPTAEV